MGVSPKLSRGFPERASRLTAVEQTSAYDFESRIYSPYCGISSARIVSLLYTCQ